MIIFNEIDNPAADWLENLQLAGEIPHGEIIRESIAEIRPERIQGATQFHTFAGIGGWSLAIKLAGWPEDRPVWTASCPCQPFSVAGKGKGEVDERDLWPELFRLIRGCRPPTVFGEQVASSDVIGQVSGETRKDGRRVWFDRISTDLETEGYTVGAAIVGAHSAGADHIRQRLFWVAENPAIVGRRGRSDGDSTGDDGEIQAPGLRAVGGLGDDGGEQDDEKRGPTELRRNTLGRNGETASKWQAGADGTIGPDITSGVADNPEAKRGESRDATAHQGGAQSELTGPGPWSDFRIVPCTDGRFRRVGREIFPLAYGLPRSLGSMRPELARQAEMAGLSNESLRNAKRHRSAGLKGAGNAIVPEVAAMFIRLFMMCEEEL